MPSENDDFIKGLIGETSELTQGFVKSADYEKQDVRWTGRVVENNDPKQLSRIQVKIFGYYDDMPNNALPWAIPDISFIGSNLGSQIIPDVDSVVRGYFDCGDIQRPIYDSLALDYQTNDNSVASRNEDYPNKMVFFETKKGDYLALNKASGEFIFTHSSGAMYHISPNGDIKIVTGKHTDKDTGEETKGDLTLNVEGNISMNVSGNVDIINEGDINIKSTKGTISIGKNQVKYAINNLPNCLVTGAPHFIGDGMSKC